jgi:alpha-ketoglutarate-dependent 2,4-dichlorophenoxyacetate dioxygenase
MTIDVTRLGPTFFARVTGVVLSAPLDEETFAAIHRAFLEHGVLFFPGQHLDDAAQEAFSRRFGELEETFEYADRFTARLGNVDYDGSPRQPDDRISGFLRANQQWHSDSTFFQAPASISFLSAHQVPAEGGETQWADMHAAWAALPAARQAELEGLVVEHDFQKSRRKTGHEFDEEERRRWPPVLHPLVRVHEETGEKAIYVGSQAVRVVGWSLEDSEALFTELLDLATRDCFVHTHRWQVGDLVMWDNRRVNHRGRSWDESKYVRDVRRTTVKGTVPTVIDGRPVNEYAYAREAASA